MSVACKLCIFTVGLRMRDEDKPLFDDDEQLYRHLEIEHHMCVKREGETATDAMRRLVDDPLIR